MNQQAAASAAALGRQIGQELTSILAVVARPGGQDVLGRVQVTALGHRSGEPRSSLDQAFHVVSDR